MKFGDMVSQIGPGGTFMVVGPYTGPRGKNDDQGPAVWMADVDTDWMMEGMTPGVVWCAEDKLVLVEEEAAHGGFVSPVTFIVGESGPESIFKRFTFKEIP